MAEVFGTENGIKQGSVLSPVPLTIDIDELLKVVEQSGFVC